MLTTPDMPDDYLKIPDNHRLVHSKTRRTASFIEQSNQLDEPTASNLSLPSLANSILKKPNSPGGHQSIFSRLNVHYTTTEKDHEDNVEFSPSLIVPSVESSLFTEKNVHDTPRENKQRLFKTPSPYGLNTLPKKSRWSNPFFRGRYEKSSYSCFAARLISVSFLNKIRNSVY